ncbi:MAG: hypothetical protein GY861_02730 [bacterium]|nr:hypothetical protein [bacterium]
MKYRILTKTDKEDWGVLASHVKFSEIADWVTGFLKNNKTYSVAVEPMK